MLLPQGIEKHKNLNTSYTKFDQLLYDLSENRFSGFVKLGLWEYEGALVFDTGRLIEAYSVEPELYLTGEQAVLKVYERAHQGEGTLEVSALSNEVSLALAYAIEAKPYPHNDVFSNYALTHVLEKLQEISLCGYVDLQLGGKRGFGTVYYLEGIPVETVIMSSRGTKVSGAQVFQKLRELGAVIQPEVRVFHVLQPNLINEDSAFLIPWLHQKRISFWNDLLQYIRTLMKDQLKYNKIEEKFARICEEVSDAYPFLNPGEGHVCYRDNKLEIPHLLPLELFQTGMIIVLAKLVGQIPVRKLRRLNLDDVAAAVAKITRKYEISPDYIDPVKLIQHVFKGYVNDPNKL